MPVLVHDHVYPMGARAGAVCAGWLMKVLVVVHDHECPVGWAGSQEGVDCDVYPGRRKVRAAPCAQSRVVAIAAC